MINSLSKMDPLNSYILQAKLKPALIKGYSEGLYAEFLSRFAQQPSDAKSGKIFHNCMRSYVSKLRTLDLNAIKKTLDDLFIMNPCLPDIVIMMWCLPDPESNDLVAEHKRLISLFNKKLIDICDHAPVKNFCLETVSKTNYVPIHCIDILWPYMQGRELNMRFEDPNMWDFIGFLMSPGDDDVDDQNFNMDLSLNMDAIFDMGLGQISLQAPTSNKTPGPSLRKLLEPLIFDPNTIELICKTDEKDDFLDQLRKIHANGFEYFENYKTPENLLKYLKI
jgi:hypothetical protein